MPDTKTVAQGLLEAVNDVVDRIALLEQTGPEPDDEDEEDLEQEDLEQDDDDQEEDVTAHQHQEESSSVHKHEECVTCTEQFAKGRTSGMTQAVAHYEEIPGITELREEYDLSRATINIVP